ncbi:MAG: AbrB/MazE/SpoVT family DNA-binding domain-containing protein [Nocardioides sp.]
MSDDIRRGTLRDKGQLTLPTEIREALHIEAGDDVEFEIVGDGVVTLRGLKLIPAEQAWFWTESWQRGEREASADIELGRVETLKDDDSFLDYIKGSEGR